jgi:hypothetical protein
MMRQRDYVQKDKKEQEEKILLAKDRRTKKKKQPDALKGRVKK